MIVMGVVVDGNVTVLEKQKVQEYRNLHGISLELHRRTLEELGWSLEEFERGRKFPHFPPQSK